MLLVLCVSKYFKLECKSSINQKPKKRGFNYCFLFNSQRFARTWQHCHRRPTENKPRGNEICPCAAGISNRLENPISRAKWSTLAKANEICVHYFLRASPHLSPRWDGATPAHGLMLLHHSSYSAGVLLMSVILHTIDCMEIIILPGHFFIAILGVKEIVKCGSKYKTKNFYSCLHSKDWSVVQFLRF